MKKFLLQAILLFTSIAAFAQDQEQHSAEFNWGERNALPILIVVVLVIILIVVLIVRKRKKTPTPPAPKG